MHTQLLARQKGFTLVELLLYVVIIGSLLGALSGFFIMTAQSRLKNQTIAEVDQQGMLAMQTITQAVRNATAITAPVVATSGDSLTVTMPTAGSSPTVFSLSAGALQMKEGTATTIPITGANVTVSGVTFQNLTRSGTYGTVQISFVVTRNNPNNRNEFEYQKTFTTTASVRP
jgi:prepilin-type N-terminal cleavage/methylation domain-containing protein